MSTKRLTKRTPLATIQAWIVEDFNVEVSKDRAKAIRNAHSIGCVVWTREHIVAATLNDSFRITAR
jgi:hypothetical protein